MDLTNDSVERFRVPAGATVHLHKWDTKWDVGQVMEELNKDVHKHQAAAPTEPDAAHPGRF